MPQATTRRAKRAALSNPSIDYLMKDKLAQFTSLQADLENGVNLEQTIRLREEIAEQHRALGQMKEMAAKYGYDISGPATNAQEAIQWTYFGYLAAVKSQNGAAMSFGRMAPHTAPEATRPVFHSLKDLQISIQKSHPETG